MSPHPNTQAKALRKKRFFLRYLIFAISVLTLVLVIPRSASSVNEGLDCVMIDHGPCTGILPDSWCEGSGEGIINVLNIVLDILTAGIGILIIIGLVISAIQWLTARDNAAQVAVARNRIINIVIGALTWSLLFVFTNWLIPGFTTDFPIPESDRDPTVSEVCTPIGGDSPSSPSDPSDPSTGFTPGTLEVFFVNIGNGNNIIIRSNSKVAVIDAGVSAGGECPNNTIASKFIKSLGVTKVDAMIATHYDGDHIKAIPSVHRVAPISAGYGPSASLSAKGGNCGLDPLRSRYNQLKMGDTLNIFNGEFTIEVVGPPKNSRNEKCLTGNYDGCANYASLNLLVHHGDITFYLSGDYIFGKQILSNYPASKLKADVFNVPHHSLHTGGTTKALVDAVSPKYAVINGNRNLMKSDISGWLKNAKVLWTGKNKHMIFISDGKNLEYRGNISPSDYKK